MNPSNHDAPIVVTGGAGFVGGHLARALLARGRHVVVFDLARTLPEFIEQGSQGGKLTHLRGDVTDPGTVVEALAASGAIEVVHAAGVVGQRESNANPRLYLRSNAEAIWQICDIARRLPRIRRVINISTRSVYGRYAPEEGPLDEAMAPRPEAFYGAAKAAGDLAVAQYRKHCGLDVLSARITGNYGAYINYPVMLTSMIDAAVEGKPYRLDSGADLLYEFTYVKDTVRGLLALLDAKQLKHPLYNVSSGQNVPLGEVAATVRKAVPDAKIEIGPGQLAGAPPRAVQSVERVAAEIGFRPKWSLEDGVREAVTCRRTGGYGVPVE